MSNNTPGNPPARVGCAQLQKLSQEHREGLAFAEGLARIAADGNDREVAAAVESVRMYNDLELEAHLQHEEQTILGPLVAQHREHISLCIRLGKEHGYIRSLVEEMVRGSTRTNLADFARVLIDHTLLEDEHLFPLVESLFSPAQLDVIAGFQPLRRVAPMAVTVTGARVESQDGKWQSLLANHLKALGSSGGGIVLLPRFQPEFVRMMADHLGLGLFDFQQEVMRDLGTQADRIDLEELNQTLLNAAQQGGFVCHNVEALLCVKTESERRAWLIRFCDTAWPNPILLPIAVFQADAPSDSPRVCDLERAELPRQYPVADEHRDLRMKYGLGNLGERAI